MKIGLAQMNVIAGNPKRNLGTILNIIGDAKKKKVDLIIFPEQCVGGYLLGDNIWNSDSYCRDLMEYNKPIIEASNGITVSWGNIFLDDKINERVGDSLYHPNEDGRTRKYNAIYVFRDGKPVKRVKESNYLPEGVQPKTLLPNYRIFDDKRYFHSLIGVAQDFNISLEELVQPFLVEHDKGESKNIGFIMCEDMWAADYRKNGEILNITKMLIENGAEEIVNLSASPWTFGKNGARDRVVQNLKKDIGKNFVNFYYVNCTGVQNNGKNLVTFDGGSTAYNHNAETVMFSGKPYQEELMIIDSNKVNGMKVIPRVEKGKIEQKYEAIIQGLRGLRDIDGSANHPRVVIGMSGGIDSSLVAALCVDALGKGNVLGINMPTRYNSDKTQKSAEHTAKELEIAYEIVPIEKLAELNREIIDSIDIDGSGRKLSEKDFGNLAAKARSINILSNIASKYGAIYTNNGNKVETFFGYATLDGDCRGAIAPIGDLNKSEVVAMAKFYNQLHGKEVIPEEVFPDRLWRFGKDKIAPSAELEKAQVDPMLFGYHCAMIDYMMDFKRHSIVDVMELYLDGTLDQTFDKYMEEISKNLFAPTKELMKRYNVDKAENFIKDLEWVNKSFQTSVFKRIQSVPNIITSKNAFGFDNRESMLPPWEEEKSEELKSQILKLGEYRGK